MKSDYFRIVPVGGSPSARKRILHMVCDFSRWEDSTGGQRDHCKRNSNTYRVATLDSTQTRCNIIVLFDVEPSVVIL